MDPDTYATVKAILTDPSRRRGRGKPTTTLLAGVLRCGICEGPMSGGVRGTRKDGTTRYNYRCRHGHAARARAVLDKLITEALVTHMAKNAGKLARPRKTAPRAVAKAIGDAEKLRGQIDGYQARAADFDPADLSGILRGLRARLAKAEAKIVKDAGKPASHAMIASGDVRAAWLAADLNERRVVIAEQVEKIVVGKGKRGGPHDSLHNIEVFWRKG